MSSADVSAAESEVVDVANEMPAGESVRDVRRTRCCIVGGGPAGVILSLLLVRQGIEVTLLEAHKDFDRDFRGDTIHPSTLELLDELGLAEQVLALPHGKMRQLNIITPSTTLRLASCDRLKTKFPFVAMLPQSQLLNLLVQEASKYPQFKLVLGANVQRLVERKGRYCGVRYRVGEGSWQEVDAHLIVAADGRFSKIRSLAHLEPKATSAPMDVVWFRLPKRADDPEDQGQFYLGGGHLVVMLDRRDEWQFGYAIAKGGYQALRSAGIERLHRELLALMPWLGDRVKGLTDWRQVAVLSVESSRLPEWHRPGLLLIGDAAHVMSPVGGVGINHAIQDAVAAANVLCEPLRVGEVTEQHLRAVQKQRELAVRIVQRMQSVVQNHIVVPALDERQEPRLPLALRIMTRLPWFRNLPARMIAFGVFRPRLAASLVQPRPAKSGRWTSEPDAP